MASTEDEAEDEAMRMKIMIHSTRLINLVIGKNHVSGTNCISIECLI